MQTKKVLLHYFGQDEVDKKGLIPIFILFVFLVFR